MNSNNDTQNTEKKLKPKKITIVFLIIFGIGLIYSITSIIVWLVDNNRTSSQVNNVNNIVTVTEIDDSDKTTIIKQEDIAQDNPYWSYIKTKLIDVDFTKLEEINDETVGWIQVNGTNINYPVVQASDNKYYLNHSYNKSYNQAGWVFLDYRNNIDTIDQNTIIYAHGRLDTTMFGSLKNALTNGWLDEKENFIVKLSTKSANTLWQVFSVYKIPTTNDYLKINFDNEKMINNFTSMLIGRSAYNFNTSVNKDDKILTLSTCFNNSEKVVLHAKLIKITEK